MTVSTAHRFLAERTPQAAEKRIWVLHGQIQDWFFHSAYDGSVGLRQTLELWARARGMAFSVVLTQQLGLDFSGNADAAAAERLFDQARQRRAPRYGTQPARSDGPPEEAARDGSATSPADQVGEAAGGDAQAVVNRLGQLARALASDCACLAIIDNLTVVLDWLRVVPPLGPALEVQARNLIREDCHRNISYANLLVLPTLDLRSMRELLPAEQFLNVDWIDLKGPGERELGEALTRLAERQGFRLADPPVAAKVLEKHQSLRVAIGRVAQAHAALGENRLMTVEHLLAMPPINEDEVRRVRDDLDRLVGLQQVKEKVRALEARARAVRRRLTEGEGEVPDDTLHLVFTGSPGTGKTTVAGIVARLFHALGLLRRSDVEEITASQVISGFTGETGERMNRRLEGARGAVLFIDEAHQLGKREDGTESFQCREAVNALVPAAWNYRTEMVIILAGYSQSMPRFFAMDEGLGRRFPDQWRLDFPDYTQEQLWEILERLVRRAGFELAPDAVAPARALLERRSRRPRFGNAGGVKNLWEEIQQVRDARGGADDRRITREDLPQGLQQKPEVLREARAALDRLVGLDSVREKIAEIGAAARWEREEEAAGRRGEDLGSLNMLFLGPPGTGKTTVASILGRLLYGYGVIERDSVVVADRGSLVGQYLGQAETNMRQVFERARGGVLLVDEAYQLADGGEGRDYGARALGVLVSEITKQENAGTVVVLAGYERPLLDLLRHNPGLDRRFPHRVEFPWLTPADCRVVAQDALDAWGLTSEPGVLARIEELAAAARVQLGDRFGNAGWVLDNLLKPATQRMKHRVVEVEEIPAGDPRRRQLCLRDLPGDGRPETAGSRGAGALAAAWSPAAAARELAVRDEELTGSDRPRIGERIQRAAFQVVVRGTTDDPGATAGGSGFFVSPDGLFTTSFHVVAGAHGIGVLSGPGRGEERARIVLSDEENDLVLLAVDGPTPRLTLPLGRSDRLLSLSELVVFGNAHVQPGEPGRLVMAMVARNDPTGNPIHLESDGAIEPGFSGGPVIDPQQGAVVGVVRGGSGPSSTHHVRAELVRAMLEGLGYVFPRGVAAPPAVRVRSAEAPQEPAGEAVAETEP